MEILHRGQRVASHVLNSREGGFTTIAEHMPAAHRAQMEWTPQRLIHWGQTIGPATAEAVTRLMAKNRHPEHGYSAVYQRVPRLQEELRIRHGSGAFGKWLLQLAKTDVLVLDDWGMGTIDSTTRSDLLEIIDDRAANRATIITSQLPVEHWHSWIGDATIADAILDRILQRNHRLTLTGDSLRAERPKTSKKEKTIDPS